MEDNIVPLVAADDCLVIVWMEGGVMHFTAREGDVVHFADGRVESVQASGQMLPVTTSPADLV